MDATNATPRGLENWAGGASENAIADRISVVGRICPTEAPLRGLGRFATAETAFRGPCQKAAPHHSYIYRDCRQQELFIAKAIRSARYVACVTKPKQEKSMSEAGRAGLQLYVVERLRALGEREGRAGPLPQGELADRWRIPQPSLSDAVNGKGLGISLLERIADAEGVSIDALIGRDAAALLPEDLRGVDLRTVANMVRLSRELTVTESSIRAAPASGGETAPRAARVFSRGAKKRELGAVTKRKRA